MPYLKVNNAELFYEEFGRGTETLIFSHGFLMNNEMFKAQIDYFQAYFRCIAYDHRGHGQSEATVDGYELDNLVKDAIALVEKLGLQSVHFIGMSTGGFVGIRVGIQQPAWLRSLVLMDTSAEPDDKNTLRKNNLLLKIVNFVGWYPAINKVMTILFHNTFLNDKSRLDEVLKWRKIVTSHNKKAMIQFGRGIFSRTSVLEKLSDIKVPAAVIVGEKDIATPPEYAKRMVHNIPDSYFFTIPDAGHSAAIEKPAEVVEAMRSFYTTIDAI